MKFPSAGLLSQHWPVMCRVETEEYGGSAESVPS